MMLFILLLLPQTYTSNLTWRLIKVSLHNTFSFSCYMISNTAICLFLWSERHFTTSSRGSSLYVLTQISIFAFLLPLSPCCTLLWHVCLKLIFLCCIHGLYFVLFATVCQVFSFLSVFGTWQYMHCSNVILSSDSNHLCKRVFHCCIVVVLYCLLPFSFIFSRLHDILFVDDDVQWKHFIDSLLHFSFSVSTTYRNVFSIKT